MNPEDHDGEREHKAELDKAVLGFALLVGVLIAHWFGWIP
jgi:hypothetical protein